MKAASGNRKQVFSSTEQGVWGGDDRQGKPLGIIQGLQKHKWKKKYHYHLLNSPNQSDQIKNQFQNAEGKKKK